MYWTHHRLRYKHWRWWDLCIYIHIYESTYTMWQCNPTRFLGSLGETDDNLGFIMDNLVTWPGWFHVDGLNLCLDWYGLPSGKHTKNYGKSPFQWENPLLMAIFNSYVKLPEGTFQTFSKSFDSFEWYTLTIVWRCLTCQGKLSKKTSVRGRACCCDHPMPSCSSPVVSMVGYCGFSSTENCSSSFPNRELW